MAGPILPTRNPNSTRVAQEWPNRSKNLLTRRYARVLLLGIITLSLVAVFFNSDRLGDALPFPVSSMISGMPPIYEKYHDYERHLPQHDLSLPSPEGKHAKYVYFAQHVHESGWGNVMQELLLNAHLAYSSQRSFVFDNYTWSRDMSSEYATFNGKPIPARIPLSALIAGPVIGESFEPNSNVPRAVSLEYFRKVCPEPTMISSEPIRTRLKGWGEEEGSVVLAEWIKELTSRPERCLEFTLESIQLFDIWLFGSRSVHSLFPILKKSPIITKFAWSPLITSAYQTNRAFFETVPTGFFSWFSSSLSSPPKPPYTLLPGLIALHIRRGDFEDHCVHLSDWDSKFNGYNTFPELPDRFNPPEGMSQDAKREYYIEHCFPSISQIVEKVRLMREVRPLDRVYVMSNGNVEWLRELKTALGKMGGWTSIKTSRDLTLNRDQKPVAQALDMLVAQRADVFVGNGFSSLTSNVVLFRKVNDSPSETTRFW